MVGLPAVAADFTYNFTAVFGGRSGDNDPADTIVDLAESFASLSGTITLSDTPILSSANSATYGGVSLTIDQFSVSDAVTPTQSRVDNDTFGFDQLTGVPPDLPPDGILRDRVSFILRDSSGTVFSGVDFPTTLNLSDFIGKQLIFTSSANDGTRGFAAERVDFIFTSLTPAPIPLPAGLPLLIGGLGGLAVLRRRAPKRR